MCSVHATEHVTVFSPAAEHVSKLSTEHVTADVQYCTLRQETLCCIIFLAVAHNLHRRFKS
jgi:hypothetical protein